MSQLMCVPRLIQILGVLLFFTVSSFAGGGWPIVAKGDIGLWGKLVSVDVKTQSFVLRVSLRVKPGGDRFAPEEVKPYRETILVQAATTWYRQDEEAHCAITYSVAELSGHEKANILAIVQDNEQTPKIAHCIVLSSCMWEGGISADNAIHSPLVLGADINARDIDGNTPLILAIWTNNLPMMDQILARGADVNINDMFGRSPLDDAIINPNIDMVKKLIDHKANINVRNADGNTPLHLAVLVASLDIATWLVEHGADVTVKNNDGETPLDCARVHKADPKLIALLAARQQPVAKTETTSPFLTDNPQNGTTTGNAPAELPKTKVNPIDGAQMALIPAGPFQMGTSEAEVERWMKAHPDDDREAFRNESPQHKVVLNAYYMYTTEVTVAQYRKFCAVTGRQMPPEPEWGWQETHPVVNVTWADANAYAQWVGATLPTEAQWEKAARGGDRRIFPWGNAWPPPKGAGNLGDMAAKRKYEDWDVIDVYDDGYANTSPVGSFLANPYGLYDMAGNVWEWCADWYGVDAYQNARPRNPVGSGPKNATIMEDGDKQSIARVVRGASWHVDSSNFYRVAHRHSMSPNRRNEAHGFRCAVPVQNDPPAPE